jgi:hypothetical protein
METGLENVPENYKTKKPKDKDHDLLSEEKTKNYQEEEIKAKRAENKSVK